jgi:hypothetical protein
LRINFPIGKARAFSQFSDEKRCILNEKIGTKEMN